MPKAFEYGRKLWEDDRPRHRRMKIHRGMPRCVQIDKKLRILVRSSFNITTENLARGIFLYNSSTHSHVLKTEPNAHLQRSISTS
jgi:hypothetical protein